MAYPHPIRLRGPWELEVLAPVANAAAGPMRVYPPADWTTPLGASFRGAVCYRRYFQAPPLEANERVWLVAEGADPRGRVKLNSALLGEIAGYGLPAEFDITELLARRNELQIEVTLDDGGAASDILRPGRTHLPGGLIRDVRLEIRPESFLSEWSVFVPHVESLSPNSPVPRSVHDATCVVVRGRAVLPAGSVAGLVLNGATGPLASAPVHEGAFDVDLSAARIPDWRSRWRAPSGERLFEATLELHLNGESIWQASIGLGRLQPPFVPDPPEMPRPFDSRPQRCEEILPAAAYDACDRDGIEVLQAVPAAWFERVAPRLARHPSIVAWIVGEQDRPSEWRPDSLLFGRRWLAEWPT